MTADHLAYKRATSVSLIGLAIQALLGVVLLLYAFLGSDAAALTGAFAVLLGVPIWVSLALVFHQHRLERLESMEAEAYAASGAAQSSVFDEAAREIRSAAARLAWMHRWFLPGMSLVVAVAFAGIGFARFLVTRGSMLETPFWTQPTQPGWAISIGVGAAVIGFIFARFVAGMAKQKAWVLLNAGSGAAVGAALIGAALAVAHFVAFAAKDTTVLRYLGPSLAVAMMALAGEMLMSFVLNLYRPRRAGEVQRPAMDSRVLAFIAAPDRFAESISDAINYQFGFNVASTWFYRLLARSVLSLGVLALLVLWGMSVFTVVRPEERGLLVRNGALIREVGPGLTIDLPWPWSVVERYPANATSQVRVGSPNPTKEGPILWTNQHTDEAEKFFIVQPAPATPPSGGAAVEGARAGDVNLLAAEVPISFVISDLVSFKRLAQTGPRDQPDKVRHDLLRAVASGVVTRFFASRRIDEILGAARGDMARELAVLIQQAFDRLGAPSADTGAPSGAGVRITFVGIAGVHPEQSVAPAFEGVVAADQKRSAEIERAHADATRALAGVVGDIDRAQAIIAELDALDALKASASPREGVAAQEQRVIDLITQAGGEAAVLIARARAERWTKHMAARGRVASNEGMLASYNAAPGPFRVERYLTALREALKNSRVVLTPFEDTRIRLNQEELVPVISGFDPGPEAK
ncbi:MAG TPA: hypothetical protein DEB06_08995 [Phycisphaerales bacterium]|nr:hypothetical protein [Phycisphaerales bacterium]